MATLSNLTKHMKSMSEGMLTFGDIMSHVGTSADSKKDEHIEETKNTNALLSSQLDKEKSKVQQGKIQSNQARADAKGFAQDTQYQFDSLRNSVMGVVDVLNITAGEQKKQTMLGAVNALAQYKAMQATLEGRAATQAAQSHILHFAQQSYVAQNQIATEIVKLHGFMANDSAQQTQLRVREMKAERHQNLNREQRIGTVQETANKHLGLAPLTTRSALETMSTDRDDPQRKQAKRALEMIKMADQMRSGVEYDPANKFLTKEDRAVVAKRVKDLGGLDDEGNTVKDGIHTLQFNQLEASQKSREDKSQIEGMPGSVWRRLDRKQRFTALKDQHGYKQKTKGINEVRRYRTREDKEEVRTLSMMQKHHPIEKDQSGNWYWPAADYSERNQTFAEASFSGGMFDRISWLPGIAGGAGSGKKLGKKLGELKHEDGSHGNVKYDNGQTGKINAQPTPWTREEFGALKEDEEKLIGMFGEEIARKILNDEVTFSPKGIIREKTAEGKLEETPLSPLADDFYKAGLNPGSIYTHDTHIETLLYRMVDYAQRADERDIQKRKDDLELQRDRGPNGLGGASMFGKTMGPGAPGEPGGGFFSFIGDILTSTVGLAVTAALAVGTGVKLGKDAFTKLSAGYTKHAGTMADSVYKPRFKLKNPTPVNVVDNVVASTPVNVKPLSEVDQAVKVATKVGKGQIPDFIQKQLNERAKKRIITKSLSKGAMKKAPLLAWLFGLGYGADRLFSGDFTGAGMEVSSGVVGSVPGLGMGPSLGIDGALLARDLFQVERVGDEFSADDVENQFGAVDVGLGEGIIKDKNWLEKDAGVEHILGLLNTSSWNKEDKAYLDKLLVTKSEEFQKIAKTGGTKGKFNPAKNYWQMASDRLVSSGIIGEDDDKAYDMAYSMENDLGWIDVGFGEANEIEWGLLEKHATQDQIAALIHTQDFNAKDFMRMKKLYEKKSVEKKKKVVKTSERRGSILDYSSKEFNLLSPADQSYFGVDFPGDVDDYNEAKLDANLRRKAEQLTMTTKKTGNDEYDPAWLQIETDLGDELRTSVDFTSDEIRAMSARQRQDLGIDFVSGIARQQRIDRMNGKSKLIPKNVEKTANGYTSYGSGTFIGGSLVGAESDFVDTTPKLDYSKKYNEGLAGLNQFMRGVVDKEMGGGFFGFNPMKSMANREVSSIMGRFANPDNVTVDTVQDTRNMIQGKAMQYLGPEKTAYILERFDQFVETLGDYKDSKVINANDKVEKTFYEKALHPGSIYTNDIHTTDRLDKMISIMLGENKLSYDPTSGIYSLSGDLYGGSMSAALDESGNGATSWSYNGVTETRDLDGNFWLSENGKPPVMMASGYGGPKDPSGLGHGYGSDPDGSGFWNRSGGKKKPRTKAEQDAVDKAIDKFRDDYNERHPDNKLDWKDKVKKSPGQGDLFDPSKNTMKSLLDVTGHSLGDLDEFDPSKNIMKSLSNSGEWKFWKPNYDGTETQWVEGSDGRTNPISGTTRPVGGNKGGVKGGVKGGGKREPTAGWTKEDWLKDATEHGLKDPEAEERLMYIPTQTALGLTHSATGLSKAQNAIPKFATTIHSTNAKVAQGALKARMSLGGFGVFTGTPNLASGYGSNPHPIIASGKNARPNFTGREYKLSTKEAQKGSALMTKILDGKYSNSPMARRFMDATSSGGFGSMGSKFTKFTARALPGVGIALGAYDASERLKQGDNFGAALSVGSTVPGWGLVPLAVQVLTDYMGVTGNVNQAQSSIFTNLSPNQQGNPGGQTIINNNSNSSSNVNNSSTAIVSQSTAHAASMPLGIESSLIY